MTAEVILPSEATIVVLPNTTADVVVSDGPDIVVLGGDDGANVVLGSEEISVVLNSEGPRGIQGLSARTAVGFDAIGRPPPNFPMGRYVSPGGQVFLQDACSGVVETPAFQDATYSVQVDSGEGYSIVGEVIFKSRSTRPLFSFNGGRIALNRGDVFRVVTSSVPDATLSSPTLTFAGD